VWALNLRSRWQHKAWGASLGKPSRKGRKPVKRATAQIPAEAVARFTGFGLALYGLPGAYAPGFMLSPAPRAMSPTPASRAD
jgi:hypothetical protein